MVNTDHCLRVLRVTTPIKVNEEPGRRCKRLGLEGTNAMTCDPEMLTKGQLRAQVQDYQPQAEDATGAMPPHALPITDQPATSIWSWPDSDGPDARPEHVREAAKRYVAAGLSVIPVADDGTKAPFWEVLPRVWDDQAQRYRPTWKSYQVLRPTDQDIESWSQDGKSFGIAVVTGQVSGGQLGYGLEVIDFDTVELFDPWAKQVERQIPGLVRRLVQVQTPRPGRHVYYRCSEFGGSQKLAMAMVEAAGGASGRLEKVTLIETKGEGGYCIVPPSPRWCHPSARCYRQVDGSPDLTEVPPISPVERSVLLNTARSFNRWTPPQSGVVPRNPASQASRSSWSEREGRPGDVFNREADWEDILGPHGWVRASSNGGASHWRRPGKDNGTSATTGHCTSNEDGTDLLYVFSSNAEPFQDGKAYCKFVVYALLEHQGDFGAAARELRRQGYGGAAELPKRESSPK